MGSLPPPDRHRLHAGVRALLGDPTAEVIAHASVPLDYDAYLPGRWVTRVEGEAMLGGRVVHWSLIRKWTDALAVTPRAPVDRGRREALAYASGLLADTGDLAVPRAVGIAERPGGPVDLWLEEVRDAEAEPWPLATYGAAARALGSFGGRYVIGALPEHEWLVRDWAERQSEPVDLPRVRAALATQGADPIAQAALGRDVGERAIRMQDDQAAFIRALGRLPGTLCHHDASRSNLVARRTPAGALEIVAFDWESTGPGPLGAEIATLVSGSLRKGDVSPDHAADLDTTVFAGYLEGLRAAGWTGDERVVRLGYVMSLALRCWFVRDTLRNVTHPASQPVPRLGRALHVPPEEVLRRMALVARFLLDRADEARALAGTLGIPVR